MAGNPQAIRRIYRFADFDLDPAQSRLTRNGRELVLQPKVFEALLLLVRRSGELVTKQDLMDALWPDTFVNEEALAQVIFKLRRALGDSPDSPHFVQTVPKRGFRFLPRVEVATVGEQQGEAGSIAIREEAVPVREIPRPRLLAPRGLLLIGALLAAAIGATLIILRAGRPDVDTGSNSFIRASQRTRRLTFFPEREEDAQFAPDGQSFVFVSKHGGDGLFKLYTMLTSGGNAVRLTRSRAEEHTPRFSPDGRWIAYTRNDPGEPRPAVWKVSALGGQESLLVADAALPDWSHDSNEIIFVRTQPSGEVTLMRRSLATGEERRVLGWTGSFDMPRWSPDGSSVAFISSYSVWVVPVKGGEPRRLTEGDVQVQTLTWTPDSRALICDADWGGKPNLWMVPLDGGPPVPITSGSGFDIYPAISCDWKSLLYTNERWQRVLWRVEAEGRHPQVIQTKTTFQTISIDSTGRYVAFSDSEASEPHIRPAEHELGVLDLETLDERRLGPGAFPGFSPDGGRLAFFRKDKAGNRLWVVELSTGASRRLAQSTSLEVPPAWSPNGAKIVFSGAGGKGNTGLTILDVAGGREVLLVEGRYKAPAWSPDGLWIAATGVGSEGKGLYVVDAKNGRTRLFSATASYEAAPIWAADSQSIQVLVNERTQPALVTLGLDGSEASPRLELEFTPDPGFWGIFEVHRLPGKGWVYVLQRAEGDIYLIEFASARQPD